MRFSFVFTLLVSLLCVSCSTYKIEGSTSVPALNGKKLYVKVPYEAEWVDIDSCEVIHGLFKMKGEVDSVVLATLYLGEDNLMPLVLECGNIEISIENIGLRVSGTPLNDKLYAFIDRKTQLELELSEVGHQEMQMIMDGMPASEAEAHVNKEVARLSDEMNRLLVEFVTGNFDNILALDVFSMFCGSLPQPVITPHIEEIMRLAPQSFKDSPFVKEYMKAARGRTAKE